MIQITKNGADITAQVAPSSLTVKQELTNAPDTAQFSIILSAGRAAPVFNDDIVIYDGAVKIFAGKVANVQEGMVSGVLGAVDVQCVDHTFQFDRILAAKTYTSQTISAIIADLVASYAPSFTANNAVSSFVVAKIVFNQIPLSQCLRRLADIVRYDWYIDEDKDVHFFDKFANSAPYGLTDTAGNHVFTTLKRTEDGSQLVNRVRVRGGLYDGTLYTDIITASGTPMSFNLPYQFANLVIEVSTGGAYAQQQVGVDFIDVFNGGAGTPISVLYNYQAQSFRFGTPVAANTKVRFSGNPKIPVLAIAQDGASVALYGAIEKIIRDDSIASNTVARKRAAAELLAFSEIVLDATFTTYQSGLRTGMILRVSSAARGFDDDLIIKTIAFKPRTNTAYEYQVNCISTYRYDFLDLLRKIVTPNSRLTDEAEVSEQIFALTEEVDAADLWMNVAPNLISESVAAADIYAALDGTTIHWVWGSYTPTSISDTKRSPRWDRGAKWQ